MSVNPKRHMMNCLGCGRDTRGITGYCFRCSMHGRMVRSYDEQRGREWMPMDYNFGGSDKCDRGME